MATIQQKPGEKLKDPSTSSPSVGSKVEARVTSPRVSRLQEKKDQLTSLNDRLAAYIDHIRSLETENQKLHLQVQTFEETTQREVSSIKELYERELAAARKLIDDLSKENAQLTVFAGTFKSEGEEWMRKYTQKDRELSALQKKFAGAEARISDTESKLATALRDVDKAQEKYTRAKSDAEDIDRQLATARKQVEDETLAKVDLENRVQSLKEELAFQTQLHQAELAETRTRLEITLDEVDSRAEKEVENKLQSVLSDLRKRQEEQTQSYREDLENIYGSKIQGLQKELASQDGLDEANKSEISTYKSRITELQGQIKKLIGQNAGLESKLVTVEADLALERDRAQATIESKEREIKFLRNQMEEQMKEYQDLLDVKTSLDLEIAAYRKLIEGEEERLNKSQSFTQSKPTPRKRRRVDGAAEKAVEDPVPYISSGSIANNTEISEVSEDGKYIKIRNIADEEVSLSGWKITHKSGDAETEYKFHRTVKLGGGDVVTVWSCNAGATHDPTTHNMVMKGQQWAIGEVMLTSLTDKEGNEQASFEMKRAPREFRKAVRRNAAEEKNKEEAKGCLIM